MGCCAQIAKGPSKSTLARPLSHLRPGRLRLPALGMLVILSGCTPDEPAQLGRLLAVWGRSGISDGRLQKPRAIAIDSRDQIYIVDMTARIQVFDTGGRFLRKWQTPAWDLGKPAGLGLGRDGSLLVADTHYNRILVYSPQGRLLRTIQMPETTTEGVFRLVRDVVQDSQGNYYASETGEFDCIRKFSPEGEYQGQWGGRGSAPGEFSRPESLAVDGQDRIWVADACNHRIQVFDPAGKLLACWGRQGRGLGELYYPYDLVVTREGYVYVCEYGNHRVQKFTAQGQVLGCWGHEGRAAGELFNPWGLALDSQGRLYVLDSNNHRVQVVEM